MEKRVDVKKIVCLVICAVMIVVACVVGADFNRVGLRAGNRRNASVSSLDNMSEMLSCFDESLSEFGYVQKSAALNAKDNNETTVSKYKSVTVREQTSAYVAIVIGDQHSTVTVQRNMDVGITENGTYYRVIATVSSESRLSEYNDKTESYEMKSHTADIDLDFELYMSTDRFLLRFNKFSCAQDGKNLMGIERVLGRWGDFSDDTSVGRNVISSLGSANRQNFRIFAIMGKYIGRHDENIFGERGKIYSLKSDSTLEFATAILRVVGADSLAENFDCGFEVDLNDATSPVVTLMLDSDFSGKRPVSSPSGASTTAQDVSMRVCENDVLEFTNINNTVIDMPSSVSTLTAEEFSDYMNEIEERN